MAKKFFSLIPDRINDEQFWIEMRQRNRWLILMRYGIVVILATLIVGLYLLQKVLDGFVIDTLPLWIISGVILVYNIGFDSIWMMIPNMRYGERNFHSLHFSLIQIIADLMAITLLIYYTGGIETPLYAFYIFYVIIGSIFLPGRIMALLIFIFYVITFVGAVLELNGILPHQSIQGMISLSLYDNWNYLIIFFAFFGVAIFMSIYLASTIARELHTRERVLSSTFKKLENAEISSARHLATLVNHLRVILTKIKSNFVSYSDDYNETKDSAIRETLISELDNTINKLVSVGRLAMIPIKGGMKELQEIFLKDCIKSAADQAFSKYQTMKIKFSIKNEGDSQPMILADADLTELLFNMLIDNAYKYNLPEGFVNVIIRTSGDSYQITIQDSGMGMPQSEQEKMLSHYFKSKKSIDDTLSGFGLGLTIASKIVDLFGGEININSPLPIINSDSPGGTEVIIVLPKVASYQ